jgi:hypothetical protein
MAAPKKISVNFMFPLLTLNEKKFFLYFFEETNFNR